MSDFMKCPKCGKDKVLLKTWKEVVESSNGTTSELTYTQHVCPDPECQKSQDLELGKKHDENMERERKKTEFSTRSKGNSWRDKS